MDFKTMDPRNLDTLASLFSEAFNAPPWNDKWTASTAKKRLAMMLDGEAAYGIEAYENGVLCGLIIGCFEQYYDGMVFNLREFCVKSSLKGGGFGSKMFDELEKRLHEKGVKEITLNTLRAKATVGFYVKQGMKEAENMAVMIKSL